MSTTSVWGDANTRYFYELTPERILGAVETSTGLRCTGRREGRERFFVRGHIDTAVDDDQIAH